MPELLLEVGCEELPATAVRRAYTELGERLASQLIEAGVAAAGTEPIVLGTPRRLIVSFPELAERQADSSKEVRGPGSRAAFDPEGKPTPALLGFCRGQGVDPSDLRDDGQYVWVTKHLEGKTTVELLAEMLPKTIRAIAFDKTMRWGSSRMKFARPIRWLLATFGGATIEFEIEGVASGNRSCGHRFYAPESFPATSLSELLAGLRQRHVEPDPEIRRQRIVEGATAVAEGAPDLPDALVDENVFLTEFPIPIGGNFREEFQALPASVLVTAMAKHEKMFPVRDDRGALTHRFVFVRNSGEDDTVRKGCEWVLNARFNDAKFFFEDDAKHSLEEFLERTSGILFQEKLGTVRQRADRLAELAKFVAQTTGASDEEARYAEEAGRLAKADLSTGLVSELASLQGIIGGEYARREGLPEPVCHAIASQYDLAKNPAPKDESSRTAVRLVMADQLDKLAGYLGVGLAPTGSSDPFALRRAASLLIDAAWGWSGPIPSYESSFEKALELYEAQGVPVDREGARKSLATLLASRYTGMMPGVRHDVLDASLAADGAAWRPQGVRFRVRLLESLASDVSFVQTATRPLNIVAHGLSKGVEFETARPLDQLDRTALDSPEANELLRLLDAQQKPLLEAVSQEDDSAVIRHLRSLQEPIRLFFENTMVMVENQPETRRARLGLMQAVSDQLLSAGDFSKLVIEGEAG